MILKKINNLKSLVLKHQWLLLILLLGSFLRLYHIDFQSVWLDEIHTINEANPNVKISELYNNILAGEQMPPLYYYLVYFLFKIFGYHTLVLRLFSAVLGIISLYAIYKLGKVMYNQKTGLIAALLLAVNYFHLYHSQDGRPYGLLVLMSVFALIYFIRLIKKPNLKYGLLYSLFLGLTISTHFFGFFLVFALGVLGLVFILFPSFKIDKNLLKYLFLSNILAIIIFIPSIKALKKALEIKEFWIPMPEKNAFEQIFNDYFNDSEFVLFFIGLFGLFFLIKLFKQNNTPTKETLISNPIIFSFLIISISIFCVIAVPLIRSYTAVPMILNRYFIVLLPLILILFSLGINSLKNKIIVNVLLTFFVFVSIIDLFVVSKYYSNPKKAQFREVTSFIKDNNQNNDPIISKLNWYLPYFFQETNVTYIDHDLDSYAQFLKNDTTQIKPFWYFGGHHLEYNLTEDTKQFIEKYFYVRDNYDGFQAWTKHFDLIKNKPQTINLKDIENQLSNEINMVFNIEKKEIVNQELSVNGWAYLDGIDTDKITTNILLIIDDNLQDAKLMSKETVIRLDVTAANGKNNNYDLAGFWAKLNLAGLQYSSFKIAILIEEKNSDKKKLFISD